MRINLKTLEVKEVPLISIVVENRGRKDLGDISSLSESIKRDGLIHPIAVKDTGDGKYRLLAGERRYRAVESLGWKTVQVRIYPEGIDEAQEASIELYENLVRKDLSWEEEVRMKKELHELQIRLYGRKKSTKPGAEGWSLRDTAAMLGENHGNLSRDITLASVLDKIPEIKKAKTKSEAQKMLNKIGSSIERQLFVKAVESGEKKVSDKRNKDKLAKSYIVGNFFEHAKEMKKESFDIIECDPPFAINLPEVAKEKSNAGMLSEYREVSMEEYGVFISNLCSELYRLLKRDGWLIMWYAPEPWAEMIYSSLVKSGFILRRLSAWWVKPVGQTNQPSKYLGNNLEPFYYAHKGEAILNRARNATFEYAGVQGKVHPTEKPISLMEDILSTFGKEGSSILVPFAGSGNTILAANNLYMSAVGYDLSDEYRKYFVKRVYEGEYRKYK